MSPVCRRSVSLGPVTPPSPPLSRTPRGTADNTGQHGVAIAQSAVANASLLEWATLFSRFAKVRLKGRPNVSIIAVCAPTLHVDEDVKDTFYSQLQAIVDEVPPDDILVVAGD